MREKVFQMEGLMSDAKLTWQKFTLQLRNPFRLSYGVSETRQAFWVRLADDVGWEKAPSAVLRGEDEHMIAYWADKAQSDRPFPDDVAEILIGWARMVQLRRAARWNWLFMTGLPASGSCRCMPCWAS